MTQSDLTKQGKYWFITTFANYTPPIQLPEGMDYIMGQQEECPTTKKLHWHILIGFTSNKRGSAVKKLFDNTAHIQYSISAKARDYVEKEDTSIAGTRFALGKFPTRRNSKDDWEKIWDDAKTGNIDNIPAQIRVQSYNTIRKIQDDYQEKPNDLEGCCGVWIYGPPGVGKSHLARQKYGCNYTKMFNKWWDQYEDGMVPMLDDFGTSHTHLKDYLKVWTDKYAFLNEIKGRSRYIRPPLMVITSNFHPKDLFGNEADYTALHDRLKIIHIPMKLHNLEKRPHVLDTEISDTPRSPVVKLQRKETNTVDTTSNFSLFSLPDNLSELPDWNNLGFVQTASKPVQNHTIVKIDCSDSEDDFQ